jgi:hypothetical protein
MLITGARNPILSKIQRIIEFVPDGKVRQTSLNELKG